MPNPYFKFKQFTVFHDRCAMKVGTDGVLIGAWTKLNDNERVLDVGAGSGLVSLMLAQRNQSIAIDSIEIEAEASEQANENFSRSPFKDRTSCRCIPFQDFAGQCSRKYDLIISNPPFFSYSLKSPDAQRSTARHTDSLLIEDFIQLSASLLSEKGRISFIFPFQEKDYLVSLARRNNLSVSRTTSVLPVVASSPKRLLMELSATPCETVSDELTIETGRHVYSPAFTELVKDFYLNL
ncbi:tRNA1(Val) (adenine(37)-N6)-methyltransferase [Viscerimonas tarda]